MIQCHAKVAISRVPLVKCWIGTQHKRDRRGPADWESGLLTTAAAACKYLQKNNTPPNYAH